MKPNKGTKVLVYPAFKKPFRVLQMYYFVNPIPSVQLRTGTCGIFDYISYYSTSKMVRQLLLLGSYPINCN